MATRDTNVLDEIKKANQVALNKLQTVSNAICLISCDYLCNLLCNWATVNYVCSSVICC